MKGADLPGVTATVSPAARNGAHRATKRHDAASRRSYRSGARADERPAPAPLAGPLASQEALPIEAPMWPHNPAVWFQPELAPSVPLWSGLAIERCHRIPAPDFLHSTAAPFNRPDTTDNSREALRPGASPKAPESGAAPLGWDPRTVCRKEDRD